MAIDNSSLQKKSFEIRTANEIMDLRHRLISRECIALSRNWPNEPFQVIDYAAGGSQILQTIQQVLPDSGLMATDITDVTVNRLQAKGIDAVRHDHEELLLLDRRFHVAIAGEIIEHLLVPENFIYSINHNLVEGGYAIITIPNCTHLLSQFVQFFLDYPPVLGARYRSCHVRDYTYRLMKLILEAHGFKVMRHQGTQLPWCPDWTHHLAKWIPRLGTCYIIVAKKVAPPNHGMLDVQDDINYLPDLLRFLKQQRTEAVAGRTSEARV